MVTADTGNGRCDRGCRIAVVHAGKASIDLDPG